MKKLFVCASAILALSVGAFAKTGQTKPAKKPASQQTALKRTAMDDLRWRGSSEARRAALVKP